MVYFEDFVVGQVYPLGSVVVDETEMLDFARRFDPQPFHIDPVAAAQTPFRGVIASGWYTCALFMRCYVDGLLVRSASEGSPGISEVRWLRPVRAGDRLTAAVKVLAVEPSGRNPRRGTVHLESTLVDPDGEQVLRMVARGLFGRRPSGQALE